MIFNNYMYPFTQREQEPPTDMNIWNDLQRQNDQLRAENERLRFILDIIVDKSSEEKIIKIAEQALKGGE